MADEFYALDPWFAYLVSTTIVLAAAEIGYRIGRSWGRRHSVTVTPEVLALEGAAFGLLALMIGFTFSMTLSRYEVRLSRVVEEANSIGTAALRARMLPEPQAADAKLALQNYVKLRLDMRGVQQNPTLLQEAIRQSEESQGRLWQDAMAASAADPHSVPVGLFVLSLNEIIDLQEKRLAAAGNRVPPVVFLLLYGIALVALGLSGYVSGLGDNRGRIPIAIMAVTVASVIGLVGDIDRSQSGFITVGQQAMQSLGERLGR